MGKSSTGNTILRRKDVFEQKSSTTSITSECKQANGKIHGRQAYIIDTPGLFDTRPENTTTKTLLEMAKCLTMTVPGPHAFLLVISIADKFTRDSQESINLIRRTFGDDVFR